MILAVDAGGTFFKSALFCGGKMLVPLSEVPAHSDGSFIEIKVAFETVWQNAFEKAEKPIAGIAFSLPGPFDYRNGIFRMEHKFQAVKDRSVKEFLPEVPMSFLHDANAFLGGVVPPGKNGRYGGITLGTGLGAAVMADGIFLNNERDTPIHTLWNRPFRGGIGEDFVSTRALMQACPDAGSVKEIAERADTDEVWQNFGDALAELLNEWQAELGLEKIYVGGGISKAAKRFMTPALAKLPLEFNCREHANLHGAVAFFNSIKN